MQNDIIFEDPERDDLGIRFKVPKHCLGAIIGKNRSVVTLKCELLRKLFSDSRTNSESFQLFDRGDYFERSRHSYN